MTEEHWKGLITELNTGKIWFPKNEGERLWNQAHDRSISLVKKYKDGKGLFQIQT